MFSLTCLTCAHSPRSPGDTASKTEMEWSSGSQDSIADEWELRNSQTPKGETQDAIADDTFLVASSCMSAL